MIFDLTAENSISAHGIWGSIRFANFRDSIWSCKIWEPNPWIRNVYAARVLVGPFPFHKHNNNMASAWERFVCNQRVEVPTWVQTRRTWRSHLQVTHQRHFGGQPCRTTIQPCNGWPRSTWAFRQLLPASNASSVLREQSFVLAATYYRHLLLSHSCLVCSTDSIRARIVTQTWQTVHTRWKLIKRRSLTGMRFDWDLRFVYWRFENPTFFEIWDWDLALTI